MILFCHIVITTFQQTWLTSPLTLLLFWTKLLKILWKSLHYYYTYINIPSLVAPFTVAPSTQLVAGNCEKSALAAWAEKVSWCCLNRRRLTVDLWMLCSSPPSCLRLLRLCHTLSSSTPMHRCVTNKYSNYRRESGPSAATDNSD